MFYRKKPLVIEAAQFAGSGPPPPLVLEALCQRVGHHHLNIHIDTLEGPVFVQAGDWIIRGIAGEFYPCKPDIFAATYEPEDRDG